MKNKILTLSILIGLLIFILGIVFNITWMFIIGFILFISSISIEFGFFKKKKKNDNGDSDDDTQSFEVNEVSLKDNVLYLHKN